MEPGVSLRFYMGKTLSRKKGYHFLPSGNNFRDRNYWFWVPIVGPTVGAVVGAWLYNLCVDLHSPKPEDDPTKNGSLRQNGIEEKWETVRGPNDGVRKELSTDL